MTYFDLMVKCFAIADKCSEEETGDFFREFAKSNPPTATIYNKAPEDEVNALIAAAQSDPVRFKSLAAQVFKPFGLGGTH